VLLLAVLQLWAALSAQAWDNHQMRAAAQRLGPNAVAAVEPLQSMLRAAQTQDEAAKLSAANQFFNLRLRFAPDIEVWGQDEHWATPLQALNAGAGDCEDYAIGKYTVLLAMGVPHTRLRLVYVRAKLPDLATPVPHMVLAYYAIPNAEPLILDNLQAAIVPASQRPDLAPVFSFNSESLWQGVGQAAAGSAMARLSRWRETWARIQLEGLL